MDFIRNKKTPNALSEMKKRHVAFILDMARF